MKGDAIGVITILKGIYSLMEGIIKDEEQEKREMEEMGGRKTGVNRDATFK